MPDLKIILFDSPSKQLADGNFPIVLRLTHQRKRKYFSLGKQCLPKQWNKETCRFRKNFPDHQQENDVLLAVQSRASDILREFERDGIPFSFRQFEAKFLQLERTSNLRDYFTHWIDKFMKEGKVGTASPYRTTLNAIEDFCTQRKFSKRQEFKLSDIDYRFLIDFEHWLRTERDCKDTTISVYMRTLRAVLNKAIREKLLKRENYPFEEYRLSERLKTETPKRAIRREDVKAIEGLELKKDSPLHFARDIFLFSYYTRGMNFVDIANLTPANLSDGRLIYIRSKTKKPFNIKLLPQALEILQYYAHHNPMQGPYLFPIFDENVHQSEEQKYHRRKTALRTVNRGLKEIAEMLELENLNLTSYVSRHTYATVLKKAGTNISVISEALGHQSERVTQVYLKQFENSELDGVDERVL